MNITIEMLDKYLKSYFVYLISFDNGKIIKIGHSNDPMRRYRDLCYENCFKKTPDGILEVYVFDNKQKAQIFERALHIQYSSARLYTKSSDNYRRNKTDYFDGMDLKPLLNKKIQKRLNKYLHNNTNNII